jgi:hypothetical protein
MKRSGVAVMGEVRRRGSQIDRIVEPLVLGATHQPNKKQSVLMNGLF